MIRAFLCTFAFALFTAPGIIPGAQANPCDPRTLLGTLLGVNDATHEWLAKHFQYRDVRSFDADLYFKSKSEFENLLVVGQFPSPPAKTELEKTIAWLDVQGSSKNLPTMMDVMEKGSELQKRRLSAWVDYYANRKLTTYQIQQASTDLSLILNDARFNISELYKNGAGKLAEKMVKSQYHQSLIEKQLLFTLQQENLIKEENILNALQRIRNSTAAKWILSGGSNAVSLSGARKWRNVLIFSLPDHQWAKLSIDDLTLLMKTGGVDSPKFAEIAARYKGTITFQAFYNSFQTLSQQVARLLWIEFGYKKYREYHARQKQLDAKDHS